MTRSKLVAANWKMHGQLAENSTLVSALRDGLDAQLSCDIIVCPPTVYLGQLQEALTGSRIALGAQNAHCEQQGAFTGEIAPRMLKDFGCSHVIVGHSERRELFGETDDIVASKFAAIQEEGLCPILCVGETLEERDGGETEAVIRTQLQAVIAANGLESLEQVVIAYEPVWAIGTGKSASPAQAQAVHASIREEIAEQDGEIADRLRILYGGSVKADTAAALFEQPDIDGALVGGASLVAEEFIAICRAAG